MQKLHRTIIRLSTMVVMLLSFTASAAIADKTDPELVPPDVTLPIAQPTTTTQTQSAATSLPTNPSDFAITPRSTATTNGAKDPLAVLETSKGTITIRLFQSYAPKTVANFMDLIKKGFYNGLTFHRVEPGFVIQGGDPLGNGAGFYLDPTTHQARFLALEISSKLRHNAPGVVGMARNSASLDSASCQFYITLAAAPSLDNQYTVFGGVVNGMDVVNKIQKGDRILSVSLQMP